MSKPIEIPTDRDLFTLNDLVDILQMKPAALRHHIYVALDIVPTYNFNGRLVFTPQDIQRFLERKRPAHRPRVPNPVRPRPPKTKNST